MTVKSSSEIGKAVQVQEERHRAAKVTAEDIGRTSTVKVMAPDIGRTPASDLPNKAAVTIGVDVVESSKTTANTGSSAEPAAESLNGTSQKVWYQFWK